MGYSGGKKFNTYEVYIIQILVNLISNSIDAVEGQEDAWVNIIMSKESSNICLEVIDSGKGIDKEIEDKIFNSMFTTKEIGKGTGLGLSLCKKMVSEMLDGDISLNKKSMNTSFIVNFKVEDVPYQE